MASLTSQIPLSFATVSLGSPNSPSLTEKLKIISAAGFKGIELGFPDLLAFAQSQSEHEITEKSYPELEIAAKGVGEICRFLNLKIVMLQPFANFEGWNPNTHAKERADAFERARGWIGIMKAAGTDMLQVGSSDSPMTFDREQVVEDLSELGRMLAKDGFRLCYENWCWGTHAPTWKDVWEIVQAVDMPNVGLCLDTFQTAGYEWADPTTDSGQVEVDGEVPDSLHTRYKPSLSELTRTVPREKIFILQISDAYKMSKPISKKNEEDDPEGLRARGRWSHDHRPLPFAGGYLPLVDMATAVLETGFRSWFSTEVFDGRRKQGGDDPKAYLNEAWEANEQLLKQCEQAMKSH